MFWNKRIYADAAAATPLSARARREFERLLRVYGNAGALHREGLVAKQELERARTVVAECIGAHADEIVFTASGTEANNLAIGLAKGHAITSAVEHSSVLEPLRASGAEITEVGVDNEGLLFPSAVAVAITPNTTFASIQLVNSEIGAIQPVREIGKELKRAKEKIYFHTDAAQAPLWIEINVERLGVDLLTLDAQKVLGPKGVGALYIRRGTPLHAQLLGGKQERGLRAGTENVPAVGAFAAALQDAKRGVEKRAAKMMRMRDYCWQEINKLVPDAIVNGPQVPAKGKDEHNPNSPLANLRVANNLNISVPRLDAQMAVVALDSLGIAASTRSACDVGSEEPSHVIKALGIAPELAGTAIRLTFMPDFSKRQARRIARALKETAERYRRN